MLRRVGTSGLLDVQSNLAMTYQLGRTEEALLLSKTYTPNREALWRRTWTLKMANNYAGTLRDQSL